MKITLKNGKELEIVNAEESFGSRMSHGVILSIRMNTEASVEELRDIFAQQTSEITLADGEKSVLLEGYTEIDSVRKFHGESIGYNAAVDLVKNS